VCPNTRLSSANWRLTVARAVSASVTGVVVASGADFGSVDVDGGFAPFSFVSRLVSDGYSNFLCPC
jgi:hypothetical protein